MIRIALLVISVIVGVCVLEPTEAIAMDFTMESSSSRTFHDKDVKVSWVKNSKSATCVAEGYVYDKDGSKFVSSGVVRWKVGKKIIAQAKIDKNGAYKIEYTWGADGEEKAKEVSIEVKVKGYEPAVKTGISTDNSGVEVTKKS